MRYKNERQATFKRDFIERTRQARLGRFRSQQAFLDAFGDMPQSVWKVYETSIPLPPYLIIQFCAVCDVDVSWLLGGKGKGPALLAPPRKPRKPRQRRKPIAVEKVA
jgi:hypothetical protein